MLPRGVEDLSPAWLIEVLEREVASVEENGELPQGVPSSVIPLRVSFSDPTQTRLELVAKFPTTNAKMRKLSVSRYEREVNFYNELQGHVTFAVPQCFYAAYDAGTGHHFILLEHVRGERSSTAEGCSDERALVAVDQLAHWHAAHWRSEPEWLDGSEPDLSRLQEHYAALWPKFVARIELELPEVVTRNADLFVERMRQILRHCFFSAPRTVTHRDYSLRNMIFDSSGRCVVFDWESIMLGRGPGDLASLLTQDLPTERRRQIEPGLIKHYHATLVADGVRGYSYEDCLVDYGFAILERLRSLVSMLTTLPLRGQTRTHLVETSLSRTLAAIEDHHAFDVLGR